ncbi:biotin-dependent carboxyltransferase family protein [Radiobacillus sp. PE A8.2]|uniref:5-oxoprolinase subunit C family protein n=1 Tax=Radiobacillus sp. PE A8.2 TaxID=3380349 RepID=UPI00388DD64A
MGLKIIEEGLLTTIQDLGRTGYQAFGFSVGGVMDPWAMQLANLIVNNDEKEAVLEMSFLGPSITFEANVVIALTGADMSPKINDQPIELYKPIPVKRGDTLQLRTAKTGLHSYLAVQGGMSIPAKLNSKSTAMNAQFGGFEGRKLQVGDKIEINTPASNQRKAFSWRLDPHLFNYMNSSHEVIHFIEGRQYHWFSEESKSKFEHESFRITGRSDRMGYRLQGPTLELINQKELLTEGTSYGTIQVPSSGEPIVLMADRQPTGGYPKIGQVIFADMPKLSQRRPNQAFTFKKYTLEEATSKWFRIRRQIDTLKAITKYRWSKEN